MWPFPKKKIKTRTMLLTYKPSLRDKFKNISIGNLLGSRITPDIVSWVRSKYPSSMSDHDYVMGLINWK